MATPVASVKFDNTLGALLVGLIISTSLFGLTTLQTYMYYINYSKDNIAFKWLVGILWMLDLTHTMFISHAAYYFLVQQYGNPGALLAGEWSIIMEVAVTDAVTVLVQCFLAHRVYKLSHGNWMLSGLIVILAFGHAGLGLASTVRLFEIKYFIRLPEVLDILSATLIIMAVNDVIITVALCYYLRKTQSTSSGTHDVIRLLIIYTIETGLVTSVFVTLDAVCVLTMPHNWIFIGLEFCVSKLYANSLLTILNSRRSVRRKFGDVHTPSNTVSVLSPPNAFTSLRMQEMSTHSVHMPEPQKYVGVSDAPRQFEVDYAPRRHSRENPGLCSYAV